MDTAKIKSVYVVEDDIELSTVMDRVLKSIDRHVDLDWSTSAEEAIQTIQSASARGVLRPYDLIIVDVFLDGRQSGIDLWNLCRREYPEIPVILTSSKRLETFFAADPEFKKNGPIFLQKPFTMAECKAAFKKVLSNSPREFRGPSDPNSLPL